MSCDVCVILPVSHPATFSYAEGVAITRGLDKVTPEQASFVSLSRYKRFLLADEPDSLVGSYLIHNFPDRVIGMCASCDSALMARHLTAVREGKMSHIAVPSAQDAESLKISTEKVVYLPVAPPDPVPVTLYGVTIQDPHWLRIVSLLTKMKEPLYLLSPDQELMDTLWGFPITFATIADDQHDRALFNSRVYIHGDAVANDRTTQKARAFGLKAISTSELATAPNPEEWLRELIAEKTKEVADASLNIHIFDHLPNLEHVPANNLQIVDGEPKRLEKLLVKFPTRGRPQKFLELLNRYVSMLSRRNHVTFLISVDEDDDSIDFNSFAAECKELEFLVPSGGSATIMVENGLSANKIAAVNRDMEKAPDFDVVLLASDDMIPQVEGYDDVILQAMERYFPSTDGVLWFNDGYTGKLLNTLCCLGKKYYDRFGYIYHPEYISLWADNEFMRVANRLGRQAYIDWTIIKHEHPANNSEIAMDAVYDQNDKWYHRDEGVFKKRQLSNFDGIPQRVLLSILIPTLTKRRHLRQALCDKIMKQASALQADGIVEFCIAEDRGEKSIGQKRNELIAQARGDYVIFLDDDDDVADVYLDTLVAACADGDADCVTFGGLTVNQDGTSKVFVHSLRFTEYGETDRLYIRTPNHINAIRREIAQKHMFPAKNFAEDHDFAVSLQTHDALKSEKFIPFPLYIYRPTQGGASNTFGREQAKANQTLTQRPKGAGVVTTFQPGPVKRDENPQVSRRRSAPRTRRTRKP